MEYTCEDYFLIIDNFKNFFEHNSYENVYGQKIWYTKLKNITLELLLAKNDLIILFKTIIQIIKNRKDLIINEDYENKTSILNIIFNEQIVNKTPSEIIKKIKDWLNSLYDDKFCYLLKNFNDDMEDLILIISSFIDNYKIEINIIKQETLKLFCSEEIYIEIQNEFEKIDGLLKGNNNDFVTIGNKIENLYTNYFCKYFLKQKTVNKQLIIDYLKTKNKIVAKISSTTDEFKDGFTKIFSLISHIRNGIKDKETKSTNNPISKIIRQSFWEDKNISNIEKKAFIKLYIDFSKTLFNFLINNTDCSIN